MGCAPTAFGALTTPVGAAPTAVGLSVRTRGAFTGMVRRCALTVSGRVPARGDLRFGYTRQ